MGKVFYGQPSAAFLKHQQSNPVTDLRWNERIPALLLILTLVGFGVWPRSLSEPLNKTLAEVYPAAATSAAMPK